MFVFSCTSSTGGQTAHIPGPLLGHTWAAPGPLMVHKRAKFWPYSWVPIPSQSVQVQWLRPVALAIPAALLARRPTFLGHTWAAPVAASGPHKGHTRATSWPHSQVPRLSQLVQVQWLRLDSWSKNYCSNYTNIWNFVKQCQLIFV